MSKSLPLFFALLLSFSVISHGQTIPKIDSTALTEKARYLAGDAELLKILNQKVTYPHEAIQAGTAGDVVISVLITAGGKMKSTDLVSSPDQLLSVSSIIALNAVKEDWSPYRINSVPVDQRYIFVFRYKISTDGPSADIRNQVRRNLDKKKYDKVLKIYNREISDKPYEYKLYESRSQIKNLMGDIEGSKADLLKSKELNNDVMGVVYITGGMVVRRIERISTVVIQRQN